MNIQNKKFHIFLSFSLIFLPYIILVGIFNIFLYFYHGYNEFLIVDCYAMLYYFFIEGLFKFEEAWGYCYLFSAYYTLIIECFFPTLMGMIYLYLSSKVTYNFWKNQTKQNKRRLYLVNSFLISPIGVILTWIVFQIILKHINHFYYGS